MSRDDSCIRIEMVCVYSDWINKDKDNNTNKHKYMIIIRTRVYIHSR